MQNQNQGSREHNLSWEKPLRAEGGGPGTPRTEPKKFFPGASRRQTYVFIIYFCQFGEKNPLKTLLLGSF